jgi:hypothetical protein
MRALLVRAIWVWVVFFILAVLNGLLRESFYVPEWGPLAGRIAGTLILLVAILLVMYVFLRRNAASLTRLRLLELGLLWLGLSLFFEFAVTRWVMEESWETILSHYNVMAGRFHVVVRAVEFLGPIVVGGRVLARRERLEAPEEDTEAEAPVPAGESAPPAEAGAES